MDITKTNNNSLPSKPQKTLSQLLTCTNNTKLRAIEISKFAATINEGLIYNNERKNLEIEDKLSSLENSLNLFTSSEPIYAHVEDKEPLSPEMIEEHVLAIRTSIRELRTKRNEIQVFVPIRELISSEVGESEMVDSLLALNHWLELQLNLTKILSEEQHLHIALSIMDQGKSLAVEEIIVIYKNALAGKYGKIFNRLDGAIILSWIAEYQQSKQNRVSENQYSIHVSQKDPFDNDRSSTNFNSKVDLIKSKQMNKVDPVIKSFNRNNKKNGKNSK